jgi:hypothetical protein
MTLIPELEREIQRVLPRRRRWSLRFGASVTAILLVGTTGALAATGVIPVGSPTRDHTRLKPHEGIGALTGSAKVLAVQADDPDGGPPWGLRLVKTTRNLGCLQAARLLNGQIGVLGRDRAFDDDGRFHPIPLSSVGHAATCEQLDGQGRLITNVVMGGIPASASLNSECFAPQFAHGVPKDRYCDPRSIRLLHYGLLGPQAKSIVVGGKEIPTVGEEGAYLLVERIGDSGMGGVTSYPWPINGPITEIRWKDGTSCAVTITGVDKRCVNPGYAAPETPPVKDVRAPIKVRLFRTAKHWHARISFKAPVAIADASAAYTIRLSVPSKKSRGRGIGTATQKDIRAGETVVFKFDWLGGHGRYHGEINYQRVTSGGALVIARPGGQRVGKVSFRLP